MHSTRVAVLQVIVKWLRKQRPDHREEYKDGTSALGVATQFGHFGVAKWLKEQGLDAGEKDLRYSRGLLYYSDSGILPSNHSNDSNDSYSISRPTTTRTLVSESIR